jgi:CheY-like chemotaxis protein
MGIWGSKVVAVDDDLDTLELVRAILRARGAYVVGVSAPGEALSTVVGVMPDVLLIDIAMPGEDGLALIRKVRTLSPEKGGRIPAATLTACPCLPERLAEWRRAGFQRHVPKPFPPDDLVAIVDELAGRVVGAAHEHARADGPAPRRPARAAPRVARRADLLSPTKALNAAH